MRRWSRWVPGVLCCAARRYWGSRLAATAVTVFTGYPFLRGAARSVAGGRPGTDAVVSAATIASLVLRENVVALMVLWLLNVGEYLQDLTLRRSRRAISELLASTDQGLAPIRRWYRGASRHRSLASR